MVIGSVYYKKKLVDENLTKDWVWQGMRQGGKERDREKGDIHRCSRAHARTRTHTRAHTQQKDSSQQGKVQSGGNNSSDSATFES